VLFASHLRLTLKWIAAAASYAFKAIPVVVEPPAVRVPVASRVRRPSRTRPCDPF
jgi:hypothetical protein